MKGVSRIAFALTLTLLLSLTLLLTLLLALLANLFFSLLLRRPRERKCREDSPLPGPTDRPLSIPFYGHGVLNAPTKFLLSVPTLEEDAMASPSPSPPPHVDDFVSISNPIYHGATAGQCGGGDDTPFITPKASPSSGLEVEEDGIDEFSPPLKLMKKLPPAPVDGRQSLGMSTETNMPSSSNYLCSSPSW